MVDVNRDGVSGWQSIVAAMLYLATFLACCYGFYSFARSGDFLDGFLYAYPRALGASVLWYVCSFAAESVLATRNLIGKARNDARRFAIHSGRS